MLLDIGDEDRRALRLYWELLEANRSAINGAALERAKAIPAFAELLRSMDAAQMAVEQERGRALQRAAILEGDWGPYLEDARRQGIRYARMGIEFSAWFELLRVVRVVLGPVMKQHFKGDVDKIIGAAKGADVLVDIGMATIGEAYLGTKEEIIASQSKAIRELSTPVLQVKPRMLIVPLVGVIDTERARQVTENVLHSIREQRARAVVIDVTGVPIVDSKVANHLMQTVSAAGLMGAAVIVCGMSPEIAQTLVTIGAELRGVRTAGDLQEGIEEADAILAARFHAEAAAAAFDGDADGAVSGGRSWQTARER